MTASKPRSVGANVSKGGDQVCLSQEDTPFIVSINVQVRAMCLALRMATDVIQRPVYQRSSEAFPK